MLEKGLRKIGKGKVFSIIMLVTVMLNIFFISKEYISYESFSIDGKMYRYMGTQENTSKIKCEDGTIYELTETRKIVDEMENEEMYLTGRYNSDYELKKDGKQVATYISTNDSKNTVVMKLFNGNKFVMDAKLHNELLKSAVSISKENGELEYNFKYDSKVPFEYRFIESAIMYHSREMNIMNTQNIVIIPLAMTFIGVILFVYPEEIFRLKKKFSEGIIEYTIVFMIRVIGIVFVVMSLSMNAIRF